MSTAADKTSAEVIDLVKLFVEHNQPEDYRLIVKEAFFSKGIGGGLYAVDVDRKDVSGTDYAGKLVDIEELVQNEYGEDIHVHPSMYRDD